jgi:hypothetical protein
MLKQVSTQRNALFFCSGCQPHPDCFPSEVKALLNVTVLALRSVVSAL